MNRTSLTRRLIVGVAGLMVGGAASFALATPAAAQDVVPYTGSEHMEPVTSTVDFVDDCEGTTVNITSGTYLPKYKWSITVGGEEVWAEELPAGGSPEEAPFFPKDAGEISVDFKHSPENWPATWTWSAPEGGCNEEPPPQEQNGEVLWELDCVTISITITNTTDVEELLTIVPSEGDSVEVTVPAGTIEEPGESDPVSFPAFEGLIVDVQFEGQSVIIDGPIELTPEVWEEAGCESDGGEGGELPVTGNTTMLIAGGAAALLALGGGMFLIARRRRVTFTA